ncbi:MAG TPA: class II aldolase/adducin family protein [Thermomicrobiales bacterium]|nr:class II aldolase/adducin family protein [Thermomicrobiales bacterium]
MLLANLREQVIEAGLEAHRRGIVYGTAGNFSIRDPETGLIAISPSGMPYGVMTPADVCIVSVDGAIEDACRRPSSETPMHTMIMQQRPDVRAIVHTHSHYCTVVSTFKSCLPPILTETALVLGSRIPVTRYGETGTPDIGQSVVDVMDETTRAVIMKNHGLICFGETFDQALTYAMIAEEAAHVYIDALAANGGREPDYVPEELIAKMTAHFLATYGQSGY